MTVEEPVHAANVYGSNFENHGQELGRNLGSKLEPNYLRTQQ